MIKNAHEEAILDMIGLPEKVSINSQALGACHWLEHKLKI